MNLSTTSKVLKRMTVSAVLLPALLRPAIADAEALSVPPNVAIAVNATDGTAARSTSFALHQIQVRPNGELWDVQDADLGQRSARRLPDVRHGSHGPERSSSEADSLPGLTEQQLRDLANSLVGSILSAAVPEGFTGLQLGNAAVALNSCDDCRSLAAAVEVVLISGVPTPPLVATNVSVGVNVECSNCSAGSYAYQLVIVTDEPLTLDRPTINAIANTRRRIEQKARSNHDTERVLDDLQRETNQLEQQLRRRV